jgi:phosphate transport system substrate-binding protein
MHRLIAVPMPKLIALPQTFGVIVGLFCGISAWAASAAQEHSLRDYGVLPMFSSQKIDLELSAVSYLDLLDNPEGSAAWDVRLVVYRFSDDYAKFSLPRGGMNWYFLRTASRIADLSRLGKDASALLLFEPDPHRSNLLQAAEWKAVVLMNGVNNRGVLSDEDLAILENKGSKRENDERWTTEDVLEVLSEPVCRRISVLQLPAGAGTNNTVVRKLAESGQLQALSLFKAEISDDGLIDVAELSELRVLNLDGTRVSDSGIQHLSKLVELRSLSLNGTNISNDGLRHLKSLRKLMELRIAGTQVTSDGVKKLQEAMPALKFVVGPSHEGHGLPIASVGDERLADLTGHVNVDGSVSGFPFSETAAVVFREHAPQVTVAIAASGTEGGFRRFSRGEIDIMHAARPINWEELEICRTNKVSFLELPIAFEGLTIVVNPQNDWTDQLTVDLLREIYFARSARKWSDLREEWPELPVKAMSPMEDLGSFAYFKEVMTTKPPQSLRDDISMSQDDDSLAMSVVREKGTIAFIASAYLFAKPGRLRAVPIVNPTTGRAVAPTPDTIYSGDYAPLSRSIFLYVNRKSLDRPEVQTFVKVQIRDAKILAPAAGYVALPDELHERAQDHLTSQLTGTHFYTARGEKRPGTLLEIYQQKNLLP